MLFFNSSMPRSGSELLQVILMQNPEIYASSTSPLLEFQFAARNNLRLPEAQSLDPKILRKSFNAMCFGMATSYYGAVTDRPYIIDKNRGWSHYYEWVREWLPYQPKMICMVRDLRSIIASMERLFRNNRYFPAGPDDPTNLQNLTVSGRVHYWLNTQPVALALQRTADAFLRNLPIQYIRYEDLLFNPHDTLNVIYSYLDIPHFEHNFSNLEKQTIEHTHLFGPYGDHNVSASLIKDRGWSDTLLPHVAEQIEQQYYWYFEAFGYSKGVNNSNS